VLHDLAQRTREPAAKAGEPPRPALPGDFVVSEPSPPGVAEPQRDGEPPIARGASADALSLSVWREVVNEVAEDLGEAGGAQSDSFFDGAVPAGAAPEEPEQIHPSAEEPVEDERSARSDDVPLSEILSDLDQAIDRFGEYEGDATVVTSGPPTFHDDSPFYEEPRTPLRRRGREPEPDLPADSSVGTSRREDPLADFESEPFDTTSQVVRQDPDLENEVFEALAGLRDTMKDGEESGPVDLESVPAIEDLARRLDHGAQPAQSPSQELEPLDAEQGLDEVGGTDAGEAKGQIRPRRSGILKRLFGKK
jgi:hypothetical protein